MARTGRKPKPTELHDLHGTGNSTRLKERVNEPQPVGDVGAAPEHFSADQKTDWDFAVMNSPGGVLYACDRGALEVYIVARDHHRIANEEQQKLDAGGGLRLLTTTAETLSKDGKKTGGGNIIQSPYLGIMSTAGARMLRAASELGFTPASRPRLSSGQFDPGFMPVRQPTAPRDRQKAAGAREPTERDLDNLMAGRAALN